MRLTSPSMPLHALAIAVALMLSACGGDDDNAVASDPETGVPADGTPGATETPPGDGMDPGDGAVTGDGSGDGSGDASGSGSSAGSGAGAGVGTTPGGQALPTRGYGPVTLACGYGRPFPTAGGDFNVSYDASLLRIGRVGDAVVMNHVMLGDTLSVDPDKGGVRYTARAQDGLTVWFTIKADTIVGAGTTAGNSGSFFACGDSQIIPD